MLRKMLAVQSLRRESRQRDSCYEIALIQQEATGGIEKEIKSKRGQAKERSCRQRPPGVTRGMKIRLRGVAQEGNHADEAYPVTRTRS